MTKITFSALPVLSVFIALSNSSLQNLTFIGILPLSGEEGHIGLSVKPFIERAVGHVNRDDNILNGYNLTVEWVDSKCDGGSATKAMFDALHSTKRIVFIYGGYCSYVTKSVAESMAYFNTWQISFFNTDPTLSDSVTYKNFLRVIPNELDYNLVWVKFLESNNWNRVVLLYQDASSGFTTYAYTHNALSSQLKAAGVKILSTFSVTENPEVAFSDIKAWDAKIIIGNFGSDMAQRIICMAYHSDMYGHRYVWLLTQVTAYPPNWWEGSENCTREQMETTLNGHFTVDIVTSFYSETDASYATYFSPQEIPDPGKHNIQDLFISLSEDTKHNRYTSYAYDGVWLMANALHRFIEDSKPSYPDWEQWYNITNASEITKGSFTGLTGEVQFLHRSRLGYLQLLQKRGTNYRQVGLLNMSNGNLSLATEIYWHGNDQAPLDHTVIQRKDIRPNIIIHGVLMALATLGLVLAISFLSVNIKYASHR